MRVAVVQHEIVWKDAPATTTKLSPLVARAASEGADLVLLAETYSTGFTGEFASIAEPIDGLSVEFLRAEASEHGVWVGGSAMVRNSPELRPSNTFVLAEPGGETHAYRKIHTSYFDDERNQVEPGDSTITVQIGGVRCTPFVCYDLRFADLFWNAALGSDCFLVVANWPAARHAHWETLLRARAIENQAFVVAVNRVGVDGNGTRFAGGSVVIDPDGGVLAIGGDTETILHADVSGEVVRSARRDFPVLEHR